MKFSCCIFRKYWAFKCPKHWCQNMVTPSWP
jgi:hypothetical protein